MLRSREGCEPPVAKLSGPYLATFGRLTTHMGGQAASRRNSPRRNQRFWISAAMSAAACLASEKSIEVFGS
jgi:hypothetical protein